MDYFTKATGIAFNQPEIVITPEHLLKRFCERCRVAASSRLLPTTSYEDNGRGYNGSCFSCSAQVCQDYFWTTVLRKDCDEYRTTRKPLRGSFINDCGRAKRIPYTAESWLRSRFSLLQNSYDDVVEQITEYVAQWKDFDFPGANTDCILPLHHFQKLSTDNSAQEVRERYSRGRTYSVDLVSAIKTHSKFIHSTSDPIWTYINFAGPTLELGLSRYEKFAILSAKYPRNALTPPWDIDLVWHVHQLFPAAYNRDSYMKFGRVPDHDVSDVSGDITLASKQLTASLWKEEYGSSLAICLCYKCLQRRCAI